MIKNYLEKLYQELYEKKLNLDQENQRLNIELNNIVKFTDTLNKSIDIDFELFSPRKVDEDKHMEIDSLLDKQNIVHEKIKKLQIEIKEVDDRIKELEEVIKNTSENQSPIDISLKQADNIKEQLITNFTDIYDKIKMCDGLAEVDPKRCKLELQMLENKVKYIIQKLDASL